MNENKTIVGLGEALWDVLPEGKKIGGAPANFAYHVSQFGLQSYVVSAVGDDILGNQILENFKEKNLQNLIATVPYPTGTVQVGIDQVGVPQYLIKENVAWDNIPFTPELEELAKRTNAVCFGSLAQRNIVSRNTINRFIDAMPKNGQHVVLAYPASRSCRHCWRRRLVHSCFYSKHPEGIAGSRSSQKSDRSFCFCMYTEWCNAYIA